MEFYLPQSSKKKTDLNTSSFFQSELNVFSFAQLDRTTSTPIESIDIFNSPEYYKISFDLRGDLIGKIFCFLDLSNFESQISSKAEVEKTYKESMNVLIGKFLTTMEYKTQMMSLITQPKDVKSIHEIEKLISILKNLDYNFNLSYHFTMNQHRFSSHILFMAKDNLKKNNEA